MVLNPFKYWVKLLRRISNLKCPFCGALQDWTVASLTVTRMNEDPDGVVNCFECNTCTQPLRLADDQGVTYFKISFSAGAFAMLLGFAFIANLLFPDGVRLISHALIFCALWLLLSSIFMWCCARFFNLEKVE